MRRLISRAILMLLLWIGLTASVDIQELVVGAIISIFASWLSIKLSPEDNADKPSLMQIIIFIPTLLWQIILANFHITKLVLSPKIDINPGFVVIPTKLKSDRKKWLLANAITLTPGTVTADYYDNKLIVHWVDIDIDTPEKQGDEIKSVFEKILL